MIVLKLFLFVLILLFLMGFGILGMVLRVILGALFRLFGAGHGQQTHGGTGSRAAHQEAGEAERMLACAVCGVHVPESEGVSAAGEFFCCESHCHCKSGKAGGQ